MLTVLAEKKTINPNYTVPIEKVMQSIAVLINHNLKTLNELKTLTKDFNIPVLQFEQSPEPHSPRNVFEGLQTPLGSPDFQNFAKGSIVGFTGPIVYNTLMIALSAGNDISGLMAVMGLTDLEYKGLLFKTKSSKTGCSIS